jgi:hypothetical protein
MVTSRSEAVMLNSDPLRSKRKQSKTGSWLLEDMALLIACKCVSSSELDTTNFISRYFMVKSKNHTAIRLRIIFVEKMIHLPKYMNNQIIKEPPVMKNINPLNLTTEILRPLSED